MTMEITEQRLHIPTAIFRATESLVSSQLENNLHCAGKPAHLIRNRVWMDAINRTSQVHWLTLENNIKQCIKDTT